MFVETNNIYTIVFVNFNYSSGTYSVTINCDTLAPINDQVFGSIPWGNLLAKDVIVNTACSSISNACATTDSLDPDPALLPFNWLDGPQKTVWFYFDAPASGTVQVNATSNVMDPQVALVRFDSVGFFGYRILASGEDLPGSSDAQLIYNGLQPGQRYLLMVDGVNGSTGDFCLELRDEPTISATVGSCQNFVQPAVTLVSPLDWINLYANSGPHTNGPLLGAIQTSDHLGTIAVSTEIHPAAPVLANGQKILPRYFRIEPEFQPLQPVKLRLFFNAEDLAAYNLTPPVDSMTVPQLGITHYDGNSEDCDPYNNTLGSAGLPVSTATYQFVGQNGIFYLETTLAQFSEFGATFDMTSSMQQPALRNDLRIYPVPTKDMLFLACFSPASATVQAQLRQVTGKLLVQETWEMKTGNNSHQLDSSGLPAGVYLLHSQSREGEKTLKVIKL